MGRTRTFIEVGGKIQLTNVRFRDDAPAHEYLSAHRQSGRPARRRSLPHMRRAPARWLARQRYRAAAGDRRRRADHSKVQEGQADARSAPRFGAISPAGAEILKIIGRVRCNVVISGGTGSGKTTLLNCLTNYIDIGRAGHHLRGRGGTAVAAASRRALGDAPPNLEGVGQITMRDLVKNCLRMRPERIIEQY